MNSRIFVILLYFGIQNAFALDKGDLDFSECEIVSGPEGKPFIYSIKGEKGERGFDGPPYKYIGKPGISGENGDCKGTDNILKGNGKIRGTKAKPLKDICKFKNNRIDTSGYYYIEGPRKNKPLKVYCNMTTLETCINGTKSTTKNIGDKPFWFSEIGINMLDIYELTVSEIQWIQERSSYARQILKYGCKNTTPYSRVSLEKSIQMLTWNDLVIGPFPNQSTSVFYSVDPRHNQCSTRGYENQTGALIEIRGRKDVLPIVDIRVNTVGDTDQDVFIEHTELCFR